MPDQIVLDVLVSEYVASVFRRHSSRKHLLIFRVIQFYRIQLFLHSHIQIAQRPLNQVRLEIMGRCDANEEMIIQESHSGDSSLRR